MDFANFALQQLHNGGAELSMDELYDKWRRENPDPAAYAENVAAVQGAIDDFKNGDCGRPAGELSRELRDNRQRQRHASSNERGKFWLLSWRDAIRHM